MKAVQVFVVDTNVVAAGLMTRHAESPTVRTLDAMLAGRLVYLLSPALLHEYRTVLLRPKLIRLHGLTEDEIDQLLAELTANALWREPATLPLTENPAPDPGDQHLWSLLATTPGTMLITGDRLLLDNPPAGHEVIAPAEMWKHRLG